MADNLLLSADGLYYNVTGDIMTLANTINEVRLLPASSLGWLEIGGGMSIMFLGTTSAMFFSFVASLYFFLHMRKRESQ